MADQPLRATPPTSPLASSEPSSNYTQWAHDKHYPQRNITPAHTVSPSLPQTHKIHTDNHTDNHTSNGEPYQQCATSCLGVGATHGTPAGGGVSGHIRGKGRCSTRVSGTHNPSGALYTPQQHLQGAQVTK